MDGRCVQKKIAVEYPQHFPAPEDLLHFIEATEFTNVWQAAGLNDEDDLESLQLCIMANPYGDSIIDGTGGLRKHRHSFDWSPNKSDVVAYYAYFEDYGIVYLTCLDERAGELNFTKEERDSIRASLSAVKKELDRLKTIR